MRVLKQADLVKIGLRVREMRLLMGLTMKDLAEEANMSDFTVRHVERGDYTVIEGYHRIAGGLGLRVRYLLDAPEERWVLFLGEVGSRFGNGKVAGGRGSGDVP